MFSAFSTFISSATETAKNLVPLEEGYNEEDKENAEDRIIPVENVAVAPWDDPPTQFQADKAAEWSVLLHGMMKDDNTFVIAPSRILQDETVRSKLEARSLLEACESIPAQPADIQVPEQFISSMLQDDVVQKVRYEIVPKAVVETHFWENVYWRVLVLRKCQHVSMALDLIEVLNTEPTPKQDKPKKNIGNWDNADLLADLRKQVGKREVQSGWLAEKTKAVQDELNSATNSCQLLSSLIAKKDVSELGESVLESCKYHKTKVASLIGEITSAEDDTQGTELNPEGGSLFSSLMETNEALQKNISQYQEMMEAHATAAASEQNGGSPSTEFGALSSPTAVVGSEKKASGGSVPRMMDKEFDDVDDTAFNAEMPWDDDDDLE